MRKVLVSAMAMVLPGCVYPYKGVDSAGVYINYEKIQDSVVCELLDAWKFEHDYHGRALRALPESGTTWLVTLKIQHNRAGKLGAVGTGSKTTTLHDWTKVIGVGVNPSLSGDYALIANSKIYIPQDYFTKASIDSHPLTSADLEMEFPGLCESDYIDLSGMGIARNFENYVKGFSPESANPDGKRRYSNFEFKSTGELVASLGGAFTYKLLPYAAILPPLASYTDKVYIEALVTRLNFPLPTEKKMHTSASVRELACHIKYPESPDNARACAEGKTSPSVLSSGGSVAPGAIRSRTPGLESDTFRELNRQRLEDAVESLVE